MSLVKLNSTESGWSRKNYWSSYGHTCFLQPSRTAFLMFPSPVLCLWPDVVHFKTVCGVTTDANYGKHVLNLGVLYIYRYGPFSSTLTNSFSMMSLFIWLCNAEALRYIWDELVAFSSQKILVQKRHYGSCNYISTFQVTNVFTLRHGISLGPKLWASTVQHRPD